MAKMKVAEIKAMAKAETLKELQGGSLDWESIEFVGQTAYVRREYDGQEVWVEIKLTTKNWYDTKTSVAFDPFARQEEYEAEQAMKQAEAEAKAKAKAEKLEKKAKSSKQ